MKIRLNYTLTLICLAVGFGSLLLLSSPPAWALSAMPVEACVIPREAALTTSIRQKFAHCLGFETDPNIPLCHGYYHSTELPPLSNNQIAIEADQVSLSTQGRSKLSGQVEVRETNRIVSARTAYIYRDIKTKEISRIELLDEVHYVEPGRMMIAQKAVIHPDDKSGHIENVLYRFDVKHAEAQLPAWGRAKWIERFANEDLALFKSTYSTCAPQDKAWQIEASEIKLDHQAERGVAKNAIFRIGNLPLLYTPYLSFPTSKKRKSGFLMPAYGYSNIGGFDTAMPFYWNMAPNFDSTLTPHAYALRGLMMGGDFRFLTPHATGIVGGNFLPKDKAFNKFIDSNQAQYPSLEGLSSDRWSMMVRENTAFTENLHLNINYQQVSDDYYLQDFSSNLAILTENQLLRQGELVYTTDHWLLAGTAQSYQTLHPINQSVISDIYQRLPQVLARGSYHELPLNTNLDVLGEYDNFRWPVESFAQPQGPRYHFNPVLSLPLTNAWGYVTPSAQVVENYYEVRYDGQPRRNTFNRTIPRYSVDSGLFFERESRFGFTQTLEPRLYYLNVPYHDQSNIPAYESAYMIFNYDQLFRTNRFSGFDRISDANQLAYAVTSRWLSQENGQEKASFAVGQLRYFAKRRVQLCYQANGNCVDSSEMLGYVSPEANTSPLASRATYQLNPHWVVSGDYIWDGYTRATNNADLNFHYQPIENHIFNFGYSYLVSGNLIQMPTNANTRNNSLHQATASYAWPLTEHWSSLGGYSYNISEQYGMNTFLGMQYDSCCWAVRLMGGRTFQSLSPGTFLPVYNNNVYVQVLLKGLGSLASSDPASTIRTYLPTYRNIF